jgi:hypothetical protein
MISTAFENLEELKEYKAKVHVKKGYKQVEGLANI